MTKNSTTTSYKLVGQYKKYKNTKLAFIDCMARLSET